MSKWFKFFLIGVMLCFSISIFASSIPYQQIVGTVNGVYTYVLSKQATNGAFLLGRNGKDKQIPLFSTFITLYQLRQLRFPTNTSAFANGINFLDENYKLSNENLSYSSLDFILILQGKTKLNLSNCAQFLKNELVKDYLLSAMLLPKTSKSSSNHPAEMLSRISLILNVVKYSNKKELVGTLNGMQTGAQVNQADIDDMLPGTLANLYKNLSQTVLNVYDNERNARSAMIALYAQAQINDILLNGYGEKVRSGEMKYLKSNAGNLLGNSSIKKAIEEVENSQKNDGSWDVSALDNSQNSNAKDSQFENIELTAMNVYSLLKCGVPATNSTVEKGIEYLVNKLSNPAFMGNVKLLQGFFMPIKALESYLIAKWGKHYDVKKELSDLKYAKLDETAFSDLLSKMYILSMKDYISQVVFGK